VRANSCVQSSDRLSSGGSSSGANENGSTVTADHSNNNNEKRIRTEDEDESSTQQNASINDKEEPLAMLKDLDDSGCGMLQRDQTFDQQRANKRARSEEDNDCAGNDSNSHIAMTRYSSTVTPSNDSEIERLLQEKARLQQELRRRNDAISTKRHENAALKQLARAAWRLL